jgi:hypothetical protein
MDGMCKEDTNIKKLTVHERELENGVGRWPAVNLRLQSEVKEKEDECLFYYFSLRGR